MVLSKGEKTYQVVINILLIIVTLTMILPLVLLFMCSVTDENTLINNGYSFFPAKFGLTAYQYIWSNRTTIFRAYGLTIVVTAIGTVCSVLLAALISYPLSLKNLPGRSFFNFYVFFTMLFSGGLVPAYIMWTTTFSIKNTIFAYLMPNLLLSAFNIILVRTFFMTSIPDALYEAARIDGATYFRIFWQIVLPLGKPILVTIGLFSGLAFWNDWTNGLYYITKNTNLYGIQNLLNTIISNLQFLSSNATAAASAGEQLAKTPTTGVQMAIAFVAILPILILFPFLQKYYSKGISLGAVK